MIRRRMFENRENFVSTEIKDFLAQDSVRRTLATEKALSVIKDALEKLNQPLTILAFIELRGVEFVFYDIDHTQFNYQLKIFTDCFTPSLYYKRPGDKDYLKRKGYKLKSTSVEYNAKDIAEFALLELSRILDINKI